MKSASSSFPSRRREDDRRDWPRGELAEMEEGRRMSAAVVAAREMRESKENFMVASGGIND